MQSILTIVHLFLALGIVGLVLIQHGKGADAGAAFGSGASATVFGAQGSGNFLSRATAIFATLFFVTSIALAYFSSQVKAPTGLMDRVELPQPAAVDNTESNANDGISVPAPVPFMDDEDAVLDSVPAPELIEEPVAQDDDAP